MARDERDRLESLDACPNCLAWWRSQSDFVRGDLLVCLHVKRAFRRTPRGWISIGGINAEEAKLLRADPAMLDQRFERLDRAEQRERRQRAAVRASRRQTREEKLAALFRAAEGA